MICEGQVFASKGKNLTFLISIIHHLTPITQHPHHLSPIRKPFLLPKIIHRLSIGNPSILHRFDGLTMEMRWRSDGDTTEAERNCNLLLVTKVKRYFFVWNCLVFLIFYTNFAPQLQKCTGSRNSTYI